jgi:hypothetical protein
LAIVSDVSDQQSTAGLYWVGRSLPSTVLAAIATDSLKVSVKSIGVRV